MNLWFDIPDFKLQQFGGKGCGNGEVFGVIFYNA